MVTFTANSSNTAWITFTTSSTNATPATFLFSSFESRTPEAASRPGPKALLRKGDCVRVTASGILCGRTGRVAGFLAVGDQRLAFVDWPGGGWTTFAEGSLEALPEEA